MPTRKKRAESTVVVETVVVAVINERRYTVPSIITVDPPQALPDHAGHITGEVGIVDGKPMFRAVTITPTRPLSPKDIQRMPWAKLAEAVVARAAVDDVGQRSPAEVHAARKRTRTPVNPDLLRRVIELHDDPPQGGRWDEAAGIELGYSPGYVRQLYSRATREGLK